MEQYHEFFTIGNIFRHEATCYASTDTFFIDINEVAVRTAGGSTCTTFDLLITVFIAIKLWWIYSFWKQKLWIFSELGVITFINKNVKNNVLVSNVTNVKTQELDTLNVFFKL